ncbi:MAG: class I SAM-dependent methyltransferase [Elusimicrobia bacterium]|nr:class I SAM-dependent methyltransferase [Elusimicrobiota bacterium]
MKPYYLDVLEKRAPGGDLARELLRRVRRRLVGGPDRGRQVWTPADVIDADGPELSLRSYLEHRDIRRMLAHIPAERRRRAVEIGCGYGRLIVVLEEFFPEVWGVEREPGLLEIARELAPSIRWSNPACLDDLSGVPGTADFAMIFTVLMHMTDADARRVLDAAKAKAKGGWVLVVERTDRGEALGDPSDAAKFMDHGRPVETFAEWMKPSRLVDSMPRSVEPTYPRRDNGTYMLFSDA